MKDLFFYFTVYYGFQDPSTEYSRALIDLHHTIFFWLVIIFIFVSWILLVFIQDFQASKTIIDQKQKLISNFQASDFVKKLNISIKFIKARYNLKNLVQDNSFINYLKSENIVHNTFLEIVWTIIPTIILVFIAIPSFALLYAYDEPDSNPYVTIKVIGHQWYWSYEYSDYSSDSTVEFDSYMLSEEDLYKGQLRLLEVDNRVVLPVGASIRVLVTSGDVLHSWAIPSMGIKVDAIPGRLNQVVTFITRPGVYYGQCSELCGVNHGFMPIVIEAVSISDYMDWLQEGNQ